MNAVNPIRLWEKDRDGVWDGIRDGTELLFWSRKRGWNLNFATDGGTNWVRPTSVQLEMPLQMIARRSGLKKVSFLVEANQFARGLEKKVEVLARATVPGSTTDTSLYGLATAMKNKVGTGRSGFWIRIFIHGSGEPMRREQHLSRYLRRAEELGLLLGIYGELPLEACARGLCCSPGSAAGALGTLIQKGGVKRYGDTAKVVDRDALIRYLTGPQPGARLPKWVEVLLNNPELTKHRAIELKRRKG